MSFGADVFRCYYETSERQRGGSEQPRGGAGGGGGEEAPRAEQSRGWRRQRGAGGEAAGCGSAGRRGWRGWRGWPRCSWVRGAAADEAKQRGLRRFEGGRGRSALSAPFRPCASLPSGLKFLLEQMDFLILLLLIISSVAVSRAQVQQDPSAETTEGIGINITCSHPNIQTGYSIQWYRQLPGRAPTLLVSIFKGSKKVLDPAGQLSVSADRRSSALLIAQPRLGDAAVYYCALVARGE